MKIVSTPKEVEASINELKSLMANLLLPIEKMEWWLLKYSNLQKKMLHFIASKKEIFELEDGSSVLLPPLDDSIYSSEKEFLNLYNALDTISEFHKNEKYFKQEMIDYYKIKHSKKDLKNWVAKNEDFGAEIYACFLIDYLDYSEQPEHLYVYVNSSKELDIYIDHQDFKNTIYFLEIFNELYYVQQILPDSIEKIRIEMSKIETITFNGNT